MEKKKTIIVTGASSGIGHAIVTRLLDDGFEVVGIIRDDSKTPVTHEHFSTEVIDLGDLHALPAQLTMLAQRYTCTRGVVCCAGRGRFGSLEEFSYNQINELIDLNLTSQMYLARAFLPLLKKQTKSDLIFIGSEAALSGGRRGAVYSASKFALRGFAQALRDECARSGVRVSLINPGMVKTHFFDQLHFQPGQADENYLLPADVAAAIAMVLAARPSVVFDEINLSPLTKVIDFKKRPLESKED